MATEIPVSQPIRSPLPSKRSMPVVIELSDDEDGDVAAAPQVPASRNGSVPVNAVPALDLDQDNNSSGDEERNEDGDGGDEVDADEDTDSLIADALYGYGDNEDPFQGYDGPRCTDEERKYYINRLHEIGVEQFVGETVEAGSITAKKLMTAFGARPPAMFDGSPDERYYRCLGLAMLDQMSKRPKLPDYNTLEDVIDLLEKASNVLVITGAGISTNLGIPDFRSKDTGFYAKMRAAGFENPEEVFDLITFDEDPRIFYKFAGATFPKPGMTSPTHDFIKLLQDKGKLLRNYTQNIDNIEGFAGIESEKLLQCHGSWATATCRKCKHQVDGQDILGAVKVRQVPYCEKCTQDLEGLKASTLKRKRASNGSRRSSKHRRRSFEDNSSDEDADDSIPQPGVMKPDITFFHEALPTNFFDRFNTQDKRQVDLVLVIGTSMKVAPVSEIPRALRPDIPHIYISRDRCQHIGFDVTLLGDCDIVCAEIAKRMGWELKHKLLPNKIDTTVTEVEGVPATWRIIQQKDSRSSSASSSRR